MAEDELQRSADGKNARVQIDRLTGQVGGHSRPSVLRKAGPFSLRDKIAIWLEAVVHHPFSLQRQRFRRMELRAAYTLPTQWYRHYRMTKSMRRAIASEAAKLDGPKISVIMPVFETKIEWLRTALESVRGQMYRNWELICVDDGSASAEPAKLIKQFARSDARIRFFRNDANQGVAAASNRALREATGEFLLLMDHDDALEPHALFRFAKAAIETGADLLYADEAMTAAGDLDDIERITARPAFSYDYYLCHPYFVHPVAVRRSVAVNVGGFDERMPVSHDVDFLLRVIERAGIVAHIPDVLYRWRLHSDSTGMQKQHLVSAATRDAVRAHLVRSGFNPVVENSDHFNLLNIGFGGINSAARIAVIIPTWNRCDLLHRCIASLKATVANVNIDIVVVDHQSDDPETIAYLRSLETENVARVIRYAGAFNFSKINNHAVSKLARAYDFYLFLNNDVEALSPRWLEAMADIGARRDVGIVGATLLYPDQKVQHCGVVIGICAGAEHAYKFLPFYLDGKPTSILDYSLIAVRDCSAVTAACMLTRADVFRELGGFDETLAVGFGDTDLCLRARRLGYAVLNHGRAILIHSESATRGTSKAAPHSEDSATFCKRYAGLIASGDPFYSPLVCIDRTDCRLDPAVRCGVAVVPRSVRMPARGRGPMRFGEQR